MSAHRPAPRPKRGGEEFARSHYLDGDNPSASKKPRFDVRNPSALAPDAPEEDAMLEADEIGKRGQQVKRNAVNIDGYESDSSNEGFDGRANAKAKELAKAEKGARAANEGSKLEEENDMFADLEENMEGDGDGDKDEELNGEMKRKRKEVRFLGAEEIEGQVAGSKGGGHVSADFSLNGNGIYERENRESRDEGDSSSESDVDDEVRADLGENVDEEIGAGGKKEHAPKLDAFNMKGEEEEGRFDDQGNFVRKAADPDAVHDSWLEGVSKKDMRRAKEAADQRGQELRLKRLEDDKVLTSDILKILVPLLERGETVLEALARLGKGKKKQKPKWQKNRRKSGEDIMDIDTHRTPEDPSETKRRKAVESITGAADQLLTRGQAEIYESERELLIRQYTRETGEPWVDTPLEDVGSRNESNEEEKQWEYRWSDARDGGEAHGSYDGSTMKAWSEAGYFGDAVEYREIGGISWTRVADFA